MPAACSRVIQPVSRSSSSCRVEMTAAARSSQAEASASAAGSASVDGPLPIEQRLLEVVKEDADGLQPLFELREQPPPLEDGRRPAGQMRAQAAELALQTRSSRARA